MSSVKNAHVREAHDDSTLDRGVISFVRVPELVAGWHLAVGGISAFALDVLATRQTHLYNYINKASASVVESATFCGI